MNAYKIVYGEKDDMHEMYKLNFSDAKSLYFRYKKQYKALKDKTSYTEERYLEGILKDYWSFSVVVKNYEYVVKISPIEID